MKEYNPFTLKNKKILVTGASSGIGRSIAIECSKMGAKLYITGRDVERLSNTFKNLKGESHKMIITDLSSELGLSLIIDKIQKLDGVVFSAGGLKILPLKMIKEKSLDDLMKINLNVPILLTQKLIKNRLLIDGGSIVFISSIASNFASLGNSMYMASKGAINSFTKGSLLFFEISHIDSK